MKNKIIHKGRKTRFDEKANILLLDIERSLIIIWLGLTF